MHRHFDDELKALRERLVEMGSSAEASVRRAVQALTELDSAHVSAIHEIERRVNALEIEVDERAFALLAKRQPVAGDLRFVVMSIKIASDLERVSDLAVNVARAVERLLDEPPLKAPLLTPLLTERVTAMVRDALDSFLRGDGALARKVIASDPQVDQLRDEIFRTLLTYMMEDPRTISRAMQLVLISRHLERVADHATNIAEEVVYMVEARELRHGLAGGTIVGHGDAPPPPVQGGAGP